MTKNYFPTMIGAMLTSVVVLLATAFVVPTTPPLVAIVLAILPLAYYHFRLLSQAKSGLSQVEIDSVYYFGFLITVAALCISAFVVGAEDAAAHVETVVHQFGTGLIATGYAVVARMHLQSKCVQVNELSMDELMDKYVSKSAELVTNVETASNQLAAFSKEIVAKTIEASELTRRAAEEKMLDVAQGFAEEIADVLASATSGTHELRVLLNNTAFNGERQQYVQSVKNTLAITADLNKALAELTAKTREEIGAVQNAISASSNLGACLNQVSLQIKVLGGPGGDLVQSAQSLGNVNESIADTARIMAGSAASLQEFATAVSDAGPAFKGMRAATKRAADQLETLEAASGRLGGAVEHIAEAAEASDVLARDIRGLSVVMPVLAQHAGNLSAQLEKAGNISSGFGKELSRLPEYAHSVEALNARIAASIESIGREAERGAAQAAKIVAAGESTARTAQDTQRMLDLAAKLDSTVVSLQGAFDALSGSVANAQTTLLSSAEDVKARLATSGRSVEDELHRASAAALQSLERLKAGTDAVTAPVSDNRVTGPSNVPAETA
ncbi:hypothetical protein [Noviherbaspirillum aridicola]|uniref:Methyl-accepting chemotaxis protein n=1 Tax=Noviherbaspirillum aridicola TaxID=2849687 RepID=A0ABQ4Q2N3_9BURK|nr:hypothetical protein [Noviherbaspirillum aridicola]GIZ51110.1 hypothetical protein NCCP691_11240 [Noviherbaspirillum aridicola]